MKISLLRFTIFVLIFMAAMLSLFFIGIQINNDDRPGINAKSVGGSKFKRFNNHIYINNYLVNGADANSFSALSGAMYALGRDNQRVFCGTRPIPGLRPNAIQFAANGYVSDGKNVWFCSNEKDNPDYHWWQIFIQRNCADCLDKSRPRDYMLTKIKGIHALSIKTMISGYVQDQHRIYYQGLAIPDSDGQSAQSVVRGFGSFKGSKSGRYLRDNRHVYFDGQTLKEANPASFTEWVAEGEGRPYGLDNSNGQFYVGAIKLPHNVDGVDSNNLQPFLFDETRGYHELFINVEGIWYWDYKDEQFNRACRNPFASGPLVKNLSKGIWADERNTFFSRSVKVWRKGRGDKSLKWRITRLIGLPGFSMADWKNVGELKHDIWTKGTLWQAKGRYYFSPDSGNGHGFDDALYLVRDLSLLRRNVAERGNIMESLQSLDSGHETLIVCEARSYYSGMFGF
ncbi:DKNYY domain-containing protein [Klebsiella aerogenes]|uniref:DKNYY domain-containing protein n=1 Tax=Klebsiella aerogenes TaxID=548 RepID=UPI002DB6CBA5|nr:DKNYY domain-containing protein [Klebsiella aerogenes]MEB5742656.1 DKNYY domain-containing protein [Klebsiella aerogenes]